LWKKNLREKSLWEASLWEASLWEASLWEARPRGDYVQDERYIATSTWMCDAIVSGLHSITMDVRRDW
jgi:hypothetical protein